MISREFCLTQLYRMNGLPGYPRRDEALRSLIEAMAEWPTETALKRFVDDTLRSSVKCLLPSDLWRARSQHVGWRAHETYRCMVCYDEGITYQLYLHELRAGHWRRRERITPEQWAEIREKVGDKQTVYDVPVRCECKMPKTAPPEREKAA